MLTVQHLTSGYGSAKILNGVNLDLGSKEVVAILGRNGVGKTTLLKTVMGIVATQSGTTELKGQNITKLPTHDIAKAGIGYVPQGRGIFDKLSVKENLRMGLRSRPDGSDEIPEYIYEKFPILLERSGQLAGTLSGGQKQQLAISRALCGDPKLLLLDEPSEGIQPNIVQEIGSFVRELVERRDISVLIVEQNLELIGLAADRFEIMVKGELVHRGLTSELNNEEMLKEYLSV
ncbi:urea ABC transporter ATP-binding subunit UrtE [Hoeflea poritis]|uniref:Urea ABC transporter ATP-binding subunit UrtE n=1 Tax=Hoeflea poritis TaxID=2993659 RepID=A0ABT4VVF4_9HYPH|nr:urea ABC transporter ATP-binding subunit UrtE [Hoeflea poritis]MDA4848689.1 urea ABC transporter ATP-binding subunit UrtE [Hoeflea poritis]